MIFIKNISIRNFRNYKSTDVDLNEETGVFFVYGDNGAGKSTLLNAVNWCLYGDIVFHGVEQTPEVKPNWANDDDVTKVRLIIRDNDKKYQFIRTASGFDNTGTLDAREIDNNGNAASSLPPYEAEGVIRRILPENTKNLFFLSENFSNEILGHKSTNSLKNNVYNVSELDTIVSAIRHLEATEDYYSKTIDKAIKDSDKIVELSNTIERARKMIAENEDAVEKAKNKIAEYEDSLSRLKKILENSKQASELIEQRDFYLDQIKETESDLANDEADITECMQRTYHKVLLVDDIEEYREALDAAREAGKIPAPINPKIIEQSKHDRLCACCGRPVTDEVIAFMDEQKAKYEEIDKLKFLADGIHEFSDIRSQINESWCILRDAMDSQGKNIKKKAGFIEQYELVSEKLDGIDEANLPNNPEERRREIEGKIEKWRERRREYARNIADWKAAEEKAYTERKRLMNSAGGDAQALEKEMSRIKHLRDLLITLREEAELYIRERIRDGVWKSFQKILPDTQFAEINIDDNYAFSFVDKNGYSSTMSKLSVGEAKTLALSLISTLSNDIGYSDAPLFVDNLFAGIASAHFSDITRCVESLSDKKQIFITYLYARDGSKVSSHFNPVVIKQNIHAIKGPDGICYVGEDK